MNPGITTTVLAGQCYDRFLREDEIIDGEKQVQFVVEGQDSLGRSYRFVWENEARARAAFYALNAPDLA